MPEVYANLFAALLGEATSEEVIDLTQRPAVPSGTTDIPVHHVSGAEPFVELLPTHWSSAHLESHGPEQRWGDHRLEDAFADLEQEDLGPDVTERLNKDYANQVPSMLRFIAATFEALAPHPRIDRVVSFALHDEQPHQEATKPLALIMAEQTSAGWKAIAPRLTRNLKREARLLPLGRVQEIDNYCLQHLIRQPGRSVQEKAGPRQMIMGIHRYESHDNGENRFVKAFLGLLIDENKRYLGSGAQQNKATVSRFDHQISELRTCDALTTVRSQAASEIRPNNVLMRRPDYRNLYLAYQDFVRRKRQTAQLWAYRRHAAEDWLRLQIVAALASLRGVRLLSDSLRVSSAPDHGRWLLWPEPFAAALGVGNEVHRFSLARGAASHEGDLVLTREVHIAGASLSTKPRVERHPIWVFWGTPSSATIDAACRFLKRTGERGVVIALTEEARAPKHLGALNVLSCRLPVCARVGEAPLNSTHTLAHQLGESLIFPSVQELSVHG